LPCWIDDRECWWAELTARAEAGTVAGPTTDLGRRFLTG
jgi:hypothetical protein